MANKEQEKQWAELSDRLQQALLLSEKSITEVAKNQNVTYSGAKKWFESGKIASTRIKSLSNFLNCDPVWLSTGKGNIEAVNVEAEGDIFLIECTRVVLSLLKSKKISDQEQNKKILEIYKDGLSTKSINPKLLADLLN